MNKAIIAGSILAAVIISPIAAMSISPTRDALLGLAPEAAIQKLADLRDTDKAELTAQLAEKDKQITALQTSLAEQSSKLASQEQQLTTSKQETETVKTEVQTVKETVVKNKDCTADVAKYCNQNQYMTQANFDEYMADFEKKYKDYPDFEKNKAKFTTQFQNCQSALLCQ